MNYFIFIGYWCIVLSKTRRDQNIRNSDIWIEMNMRVYVCNNILVLKLLQEGFNGCVKIEDSLMCW